MNDIAERDLLARLQIQSFTVSVMIADFLEGKNGVDRKALMHEIVYLDTFIDFHAIWEGEQRVNLANQDEWSRPGFLPGHSGAPLA